MESVTPKIFVAQTTTLVSMEFSAIGTKVFQKISLPSGIKNIKALTYNALNESIIVYDGTRNKIFNYEHKTNKLDLLVERDLINVVCMDIGKKTRELFFHLLFFTSIKIYHIFA